MRARDGIACNTAVFNPLSHINTSLWYISDGCELPATDGLRMDGGQLSAHINNLVFGVCSAPEEAYAPYGVRDPEHQPVQLRFRI